jgi:hypothetical protein
MIQYQEPQIIALQKQIEQINLVPIMAEAFHAEQVSTCRIFQTSMAQFELEPASNATLWQKIKYAQSSNFIRGFFYLNIYNAVKMDQMIVDSIDLSQKVVSVQQVAKFQNETEALSRIKFPLGLYKLIAAIAVPNSKIAIQTFARTQTKTDQAQIVCALERYRLAHGSYPETLNELVPYFMEKLPHDIIGGQSLKYRRTADEQFLLYSVGWNETDDGGKLNSSYDQGDWIWQ